MTLYQDQIVEALLAPKPAAKGHVLVRPRREAQRLSDLSQEESSHLFLVASYVAAILFQGIHPGGTNIIVEEGGRVTAHVLARSEGDGLSFVWPPQKLDEAAMNDVEERIKDKTFLIGKKGEKQKGGVQTGGQEETPSAENPSEKGLPEKPSEEMIVGNGDHLKEAEERENYLIKQLIRIP